MGCLSNHGHPGQGVPSVELVHNARSCCNSIVLFSRPPAKYNGQARSYINHCGKITDTDGYSTLPRLGKAGQKERSLETYLNNVETNRVTIRNADKINDGIRLPGVWRIYTVLYVH
jgi:hypothetical protein